LKRVASGGNYSPVAHRRKFLQNKGNESSDQPSIGAGVFSGSQNN
jgi:hypothetical protein